VFSAETGTIAFSVSKTIETGKSWSGTLNVVGFEFKSGYAGNTSTITFEAK